MVLRTAGKLYISMFVSALRCGGVKVGCSVNMVVSGGRVDSVSFGLEGFNIG